MASETTQPSGYTEAEEAEAERLAIASGLGVSEWPAFLSTPDTVEKATAVQLPPLTPNACLRDLQAWIEHALNSEIKNRQTGDYSVGLNSYSYVEIPEWSMRQKLDNVITTLNAHSPARDAAMSEAVATLKAVSEYYELSKQAPSPKSAVSTWRSVMPRVEAALKLVEEATQ